jgi:hypothetical protein
VRLGTVERGRGGGGRRGGDARHEFLKIFYRLKEDMNMTGVRRSSRKRRRGRGEGGGVVVMKEEVMVVVAEKGGGAGEGGGNSIEFEGV